MGAHAVSGAQMVELDLAAAKPRNAKPERGNKATN